MTIFRHEPDHRLDLVRQSLRHTSEAWEHGMSAALDHDLVAARQVMRGASARRSMLHTAHEQLQWADAAHRPVLIRPATSIDVVADLVRINRLLSQLAQSVIVVPEAGGLIGAERTDVDVARRVGTCRLAYFADAVPRPRIDREYITAGHDLLDALADLAECSPPRGTTPDICLALMIRLVETSRHVTRIA
ncbi:hypothetical protein [Aeromicrobium wangtongii]|uniref:Uncharacterized protein n=1 Tax=Aeromicrobium wangtongii TaxID=2969247 RepID=A0ABY5MAB1_9ACTN|nr:hypothetical protein [Aeromicrobium wangtongii]MCD9199737.1 hypothetical protein [Aeromicrobium wangtongii]UUP14086.1 hypothetical protein NQV15_01895 [Aeromicrobium wangtongii]